jgi:hypothetical protein
MVPGLLNSFGAILGAIVRVGGAGGLLLRPSIAGELNNLSLDAAGGLKGLLPSVAGL